jgi:hypothetical protein
MISDLSQTLRAILTQPGLPRDLAAAQIVFDRPSETFAPTQATVDLFLYDIREDRDSGEGAGTRGSPAVRALACTYLVTAWPVGGPEVALQEHQLLSDVLRVLSAHPTIPREFLRGDLAGHDPLLQMLVMHPDTLRNTAEFWSALGSKLRPSLTVTVTIRLPAFSGQAGAGGATRGRGTPVV